VRNTLALVALCVCVLLQGCGTAGKLHSQFGFAAGHNFGEEPQQQSEEGTGVAELGYVPGGLKADTPRWSFGGTAYTLIGDNMKPGIKAIARRRLAHNVSVDISAGPMITYDSSFLFNGFTGGVALNLSFVSLRSEYVSWPFDAWDEYHYSQDGLSSTVEHHPGGHQQVWFNGLAFNGAASWWAFAIVAGAFIYAGANGAFD